MDYSELNLIGSSSPHIRTKAGTNSIMGEVLIALAPALCFAVYNFGWRALANTLCRRRAAASLSTSTGT